MVRLEATRVATFLILSSCIVFAACAAMCQQSQRASWNSLPDAPVAQQQDVPPNLSADSGAANLPLHLEGLRLERSGPTGNHFECSDGVSAYKVDSFKEEPQDGTEFRRQLAELLRHRANYHPGSSGSLMRRAVSTALGTFLRRTPSGKNKLDTSYLLGVLSSAVIQTAYRPYWSRPVSAPFSDFGSRVGNDAGMNLLHEFRPGLEQLLKNHTPKFVSRIEAGIEKR